MSRHLVDVSTSRIGQTDGGELASSGFRAQLSGASLPDLVQLECQMRSTRSIRVTSSRGVGHLHFREGALVHATAGELAGETAALEILGWDGGTFEPVSVAPPRAATIETSVQGLLLRLAQSRDESGASSPPRSRPPSGRPSASGPPTPSGRPPRDGGGGGRDVVRIDRSGNVLAGRGRTEELASVTAFVTGVADAVGSALALGRFVAADAEFDGAHVLVHAEASSGQLLGIRTPHEPDVAQLRGRFGL
ncbi:MAG: DUF4388 domain-containing protein [Deltaproteobacteria bacterium]|nr:DUF4388 domain-containing protein [Deltaproteobacteria bacterium]